MEPAFRPQAGLRLEVTNIDALALKDLGWDILDEVPPRPPELPVEFLPSQSGTIGVEINSQVGKIYTIQTSPDGASWVDVAPSLVGTGGSVLWTDGQEGFTDAYGNTAELTGKYYRVIEKDAP